jgi:hypothetical protein
VIEKKRVIERQQRQLAIQQRVLHRMVHSCDNLTEFVQSSPQTNAHSVTISVHHQDIDSFLQTGVNGKPSCLHLMHEVDSGRNYTLDVHRNVQVGDLLGTSFANSPTPQVQCDLSRSQSELLQPRLQLGLSQHSQSSLYMYSPGERPLSLF